jgi:acyl-CoA thioesterase I
VTRRTRHAFRRMAWIAAALLVTSCGEAPREAAVPPGSSVLVVGDSITAGYGVDPGAAWPARLAARSGWRVTSAGVSGDRTAGGLERLPDLLDENTPALVIIELGGNDLLRHVPETEIVANLEAMIVSIRARGARVVLMAAPQPTAIGALTGLAPARLFRDVAKRHSVPLVEHALSSVLSDEKLRLDAIHPNAEGHGMLAERAADELAHSGLLVRR